MKIKEESEEEKKERKEREAKERFEGLAHHFRPVKIIVSGRWTHCFFHDGGKELVKVSVKHSGKIQEFDPEFGVAMCIAKYIYTSRRHFVMEVDRLVHYDDPDLKDYVEGNREAYYAERKAEKEREAKAKERMKNSKVKPLEA